MPRAWRPRGSRASKGSGFDGAEPVSAERGISSLIQTQAVGDLYRIYLTAQWDGFTLQPLSLTGSTGLGVAGGLGYLYLEPAKP